MNDEHKGLPPLPVHPLPNAGGALDVDPSSLAGREGHDAHVRQEEDRPPTALILRIGIIGVVVTVVSIFISYGFQLHAQSDLPEAPTPAVIPGTYEAQGNAGILERSLLVEIPGEHADGEAQQLQRAEDTRLSTYGWIDRQRGLIRLPIRQAMDQVVQAYGQRR